MKTLCILTTYNEVEFLPFKLNFCKHHNLDLYVIDNYSNDGTWQWLQDNNIKSHRFDTNGAFALELLQAEIINTLKFIKDKPDWVIYNGTDLFPISLPNLNDEIASIDSLGYNIASIDCIGMFNTGEVRQQSPFNTFFHYALNDKKNNKPLQMIHKYHPNIKYFGDHVYIPGEEPKVKKIDGVMINYGQTKTSAEREETLSRRQRAWDLNITPRGHGYHYSVGHKRNWLWSKSECIDIRESEYLPYIKHLQQVCI